jgi:16S rRNA (cytidine1402-2'-O)-methyltransferase
MIQGSLYLVATPIGNMEDITLRALRVLREVDIVFAEDTRRTHRLLKHYDIAKPLLSYHDHNKLTCTPVVIDKLRTGNDVALVSDSGTPGISDPGFHLVREVIRSDLPVIPIPGPTALVTALIVSGLPADRFVFEGWLPRKSGKRANRIRELAQDTRTLIFYESPHRLLRMLNDCLLILGDRRAAVCRELTKKFETVERQKISGLVEEYSSRSPKGEFVVLIEGHGENKNSG